MGIGSQKATCAARVRGREQTTVASGMSQREALVEANGHVSEQTKSWSVVVLVSWGGHDNREHSRREWTVDSSMFDGRGGGCRGRGFDAKDKIPRATTP